MVTSLLSCDAEEITLSDGSLAYNAVLGTADRPMALRVLCDTKRTAYDVIARVKAAVDRPEVVGVEVA